MRTGPRQAVGALSDAVADLAEIAGEILGTKPHASHEGSPTTDQPAERDGRPQNDTCEMSSMSQQTPTGGDWNTGPAPGNAPLRGDSGSGGGGTVFAAVLLLVSGILAICQGIAAIAEDDVYARIGNYVFEFDLTAWGWIHLILGLIVVLIGWGLFRDMNSARVAGIAVAGLSMIANFIWLPYQPWWSITIIAIDVFVIWALCSSWSRATA